MQQRSRSRVITLPRQAERRRVRLALAVGSAALGLLAVSTFSASEAHADELRMEPIVERTNVNMPARGMTMDRVRSAFGQPAGQRSAVGDPPITRWEYDGFVVYFEYQYVLHTVVKRGR